MLELRCLVTKFERRGPVHTYCGVTELLAGKSYFMLGGSLLVISAPVKAMMENYKNKFSADAENLGLLCSLMLQLTPHELESLGGTWAVLKERSLNLLYTCYSTSVKSQRVQQIVNSSYTGSYRPNCISKPPHLKRGPQAPRPGKQLKPE